jgi:hypothetical protein
VDSEKGFELLLTISQAVQSNILTSQKTWIFLDVMNENLKSPDLVMCLIFFSSSGFCTRNIWCISWCYPVYDI